MDGLLKRQQASALHSHQCVVAMKERSRNERRVGCNFLPHQCRSGRVGQGATLKK